MKSLYITSVDRYSGKTAACLALGTRFQADGHKVGYLKPFSLQPWQITDAKGEVHTADEDAAFVKSILDLKEDAWQISPVVITSEFLVQHLKPEGAIDLMPGVLKAHQLAAEGKDIVLLEGGGSLREGYSVGLPTVEVAQATHSQVVTIIPYHDEVQVIDDALSTQKRLGDLLGGVLINRLPAENRAFMKKSVSPFLEKKGVAVLGLLPEERILASLTVGELAKILDAEVLTKYHRSHAPVESLSVGAMTADAAVSRFRKVSNKAVITGGDRADIQLAALETSTTCLILTGNLRPSPLVVKQADEFGVTVLLVRHNTMETITAIQKLFGKSRLGDKAKLRKFQAMLDKHCDVNRLYKILGLKI